MIYRRNGDGTSTYVRENWKEYFRFFVSIPQMNNWPSGKMTFPRGYAEVYTDWKRKFVVFYFIPLIPFIIVKRWLHFQWFELADWFIRHGYLKHEEGAVIPFSWPFDLQ